nr:MAG TPA: hypothetical protein [Caudoviricetes sp.]
MLLYINLDKAVASNRLMSNSLRKKERATLVLFVLARFFFNFVSFFYL